VEKRQIERNLSRFKRTAEEPRRTIGKMYYRVKVFSNLNTIFALIVLVTLGMEEKGWNRPGDQPWNWARSLEPICGECISYMKLYL
jgi:hypothetical protein